MGNQVMRDITDVRDITRGGGARSTIRLKSKRATRQAAVDDNDDEETVKTKGKLRRAIVRRWSSRKETSVGENAEAATRVQWPCVIMRDHALAMIDYLRRIPTSMFASPVTSPTPTPQRRQPCRRTTSEMSSRSHYSCTSESESSASRRRPSARQSYSEYDGDEERDAGGCRPQSIAELTARTNFTKREVQMLYRGFKENCPNGQVTVEQFQSIFANFFYRARSSMYARMVFRTFDDDRNGVISFDEFVNGLSVLSRGTDEEKLRWIFTLYDGQDASFITQNDMYHVIRAIYDLMGPVTVPPCRANDVMQHAVTVFTKLDTNEDGKVDWDEFLTGCRTDSTIYSSLALFGTVFH